MMNHTHTPGPWTASKKLGAFCNSVAIEYSPGERIGYATHIPNRADGNASQFANARLMAAAPDMLTALQAMLNYANLGAYERADAVKKARAAIAKAIGAAA